MACTSQNVSMRGNICLSFAFPYTRAFPPRVISNYCMITGSSFNYIMGIGCLWNWSHTCSGNVALWFLNITIWGFILNWVCAIIVCHEEEIIRKIVLFICFCNLFSVNENEWNVEWKQRNTWCVGWYPNTKLCVFVKENVRIIYCVDATNVYY